MKISRMFAVVALTLVTSSAMSEEVSGKWNAWIETPQGKLPLVLDFSASGSQLTGTFSNDFMPNIPIQEGTVAGSELSFKLVLQAVTLGYSGLVKQDEMTLKAEVLEERPSPPQQTLGAILRSVDVLVATRAE